MKKVKLLEQFLEEQKMDEGLFDVVTKSKAFIRNPISATKITNNGKKLAQAQIDDAANDLDFEKRKLAASQAAKTKIENLKKKGDNQGAEKIKSDYDDSKEVLSKAHDLKGDALEDKVKSIEDRIEELSKKNSTLQDLASLVKTAARVKKNEVLFKGADEEEKKQLKIQIQKDTERIDNLQKGFSDYEGSKDKEEKKPDAKKDDVTVDTKVKEQPQEQPHAAKDTEKTADAEKDKPLTTTQKPTSTEKPEDEVARTREDVRSAQRNLQDLKNKIKFADEKIETIKSGKYDKKKITDPEAELKKLQDSKARMEGDLPDYQKDVEDTVKANQDAEKKVPAKKEEPKAETPKAEPKKEEPKAETPKAEPKKEEPKAETPKRKEVEDQIAKDNAEPAKVTTDTKQYKIDKLEKEVKAAEDEYKKLLLDPKYQEGSKKDKELQDKADAIDKELSAIDKEKDPTAYASKMKEVQAANQEARDFRKKFSEENKDLEDKADAAEIKVRHLKNDLYNAKHEEEAPKKEQESITSLKGFKDFLNG